jgi:uncharacterized protein
VKYVFVDGYNVINSWPELNKIKNYSYENARVKLSEELNNYGVYNGFKIILVFDAHLVSGSLEKREIISRNLEIIFTMEGETADSFIERTVNNIGRKYEVSVVTSDSLEQQVVFQRGAVRMSSIEFYHEVKNIEKTISFKIEKKYSEKGNKIEDNVQPEVLEKLEKMRRSN